MRQFLNEIFDLRIIIVGQIFSNSSWLMPIFEHLFLKSALISGARKVMLKYKNILRWNNYLKLVSIINSLALENWDDHIKKYWSWENDFRLHNRPLNEYLHESLTDCLAFWAFTQSHSHRISEVVDLWNWYNLKHAHALHTTCK